MTGMWKRTIAAAVLLLGFVAPATAAAAPPTSDPYPPPLACLSVTTPSTAFLPGAVVTVSAQGTGLAPGGTVNFTIIPPASSGLEPIVGTGIANSSGVASVTITLPNALGTYQVFANTQGCEEVESSFIIRNLPSAGSDTAPWLLAAGATLAIGLLFVVVAARRRRPRQAAA